MQSHQFKQLSYLVGLLFGLLAMLHSVAAFAGPGDAELVVSTTAHSLKPFMTDGCTDFVDGPPGHPRLWLHCCTEHDLRYWFGGSKKDMDFTDRRLRSCVNRVAGPVWATIIYQGVRIGHLSPIKSETHWGWGWTPARRNLSLTENEVSYVEVELLKLPLRAAYLDQFIQTYLVEHRSK